MNWQRRHESQLPPAIHEKYGDKATGYKLWLVSKRQHGGVFAVLLTFVGRTYSALATSSYWYCHNNSDVKAECPRTQARVIHGVSCLWNHISAWNVTFLVLAHFVVSRRAVVISFLSVDFSQVNNNGLCANHLVNLLSPWLLRHGTLIVHLRLTGYFFF